MIKRSLNISSLYLLTLVLHEYVFLGGGGGGGGEIVVKYMYCLPRLTLSQWKNGTPLCPVI